MRPPLLVEKIRAFVARKNVNPLGIDPKQINALKTLVGILKTEYPWATAVTHEELAPKQARGCPGIKLKFH